MTSNFIKKQKKLYKSLKPCHCPALQEAVHFNATGLNHLLYSRRRPRKLTEQHYRANLITYITEVITSATQAVKALKSQDPLIVTWSLQHEVRDSNNLKQVIKVILMKKGAGNIYFLSAMQKKNSKETKKPRG